MGVDVSITISGVTGWDESHRFADDIAQWLGMYRRDGLGSNSKGPWVVEYHEGLGALELSCMTRYYGPDYERGSWPEIFAALVCLTAMYPGSTIRYGGDSSPVEELEKVTPDFLDEMWRHYLGPDGDAYHQFSRTFNRRFSIDAGQS